MSLVDGSRLRQLFWALHIGGWTLFGVGMALSRLGQYPTGYMLATKAVLAASGFLVTLGLRAIYRRSLPENASLMRVVSVTLALSYAGSLVWSAFYNTADARIVSAMLDRRVSIDSLSALFSEALYHAFTLLAWSVFYFGIKRQVALEAASGRIRRAEGLAHEAQLRALRFQLQPHFLFNTLNAISTLIVEQRPQDASKMLSRLSEFLRFTLETPNGHEVPLDAELQLAQRYLEIESVRFGPRLRVTFKISPVTRRAQVPTLLLQPLLENAIRHGVARRRTGALVTVEARRDQNNLVISVTDCALEPKRLEAGDMSAGAGIGLTNTRARLEQLYGDTGRFEATTVDGRGFAVKVTIPFRDSA